VPNSTHSIKNEVRRWAGRANELATSDEQYPFVFIFYDAQDNPDLTHYYINSVLADKREMATTEVDGSPASVG